MFLLWIVYFLPFIHIIPYLWFDFTVERPLLLWGILVNPYMLDEKTIQLTAMIGAVGGLGFVFGTSLNDKKIEQYAFASKEKNITQIKSLSIVAWIFWVAAGVVLAWLTAPQETLFEAAYTGSVSLLQNSNFDSAIWISNIILIFTFNDSIIEENTYKKRLKLKIIIPLLVFIIIYFQILRGSRTSVPLVFGLLLVYYFWAAPLMHIKQKNIPWLKISMGAFGLVVASMILGIVRQFLVDVSDFSGLIGLMNDLVQSDELSVSNILHGTWSAVLLTPLSVAGDYNNGLLPVKLGKDYVDFILSIPPGFLAEAVGYVRPLDSGAGPAWQMRYGLGGTHFSVVPFMNFRMIGVFVIPAIISFIFTTYEKLAMKKMTVINLSLLCTIAAVAPHWLWYGDKYGFNAIVIWSILGFLYRLSFPIKSGRLAA